MVPTSPTSNEETPLLGLDGIANRQHGSGSEARQERDHGLDLMREWFSRAFHTSPSMKNNEHGNNNGKHAAKPRPGAFPRPVGGTSKLGTFTGVFVPTTLNVLSILMFLRFGFILGQAGVIGMMVMLIGCYAINLLTTMSISAIATNGTVRGGGAYYLISRSLGPEFGGSIGIVFYLGMVFNTSLNAVGLIDCFIDNFGTVEGSWGRWMYQGFAWQYLWATVVLVACTAICLAGSGLFARCSNGLLVLLLVATFSIPLSTLFVRPFEDREEGIRYTGLSLDTLRNNLMPQLTKGAAGSQLKGVETFQDLFGILFPATGGIFAGASMSGDLRHPSKAIPKGTLYGLALTFVSYTVVILALAATVTRGSFYNNTNVIQLTNMSRLIILLGEFATSSFSVLMGVIGSAKLLQALARDDLIPGLSIFGQGTSKSDDPTYAIIITYIIAQLTMLSDINQIASFITMTYLMTFLVTNLACFLLKVSSAPNFRPSFHFFSWQTAAVGALASGATMFFVDGFYASGCLALLIIIFLLIHYTTPPKPWGDVSQSLIYHQVRKYLLRLKQEHVKFWRPQILLLVNDPRRQYKLIQFCNSLKKGALFVLGHVIVSDDFAAAVPEVRRQQQAWTKYIDFSKIKAFVNIVISPTVEWGARNIVLGAGLGGMRPNIVVMGFYNLGELRLTRPSTIPATQVCRPSSKAVHQPVIPTGLRERKKRLSNKLSGALPTDAMRTESSVPIQSYVTVVEDMVLRLQINVAIAKGFQELEVPLPKPSRKQRLFGTFGISDVDEAPTKKYIDMWPIQMSAEIATAGEDPTRKNALTTNFDTYTLILQLGCILNTVPSWKRTYKLRVCVFVEYETDVEEERSRVTTLLRNLRIEAKVLVFWLASGDLKTYEVIINGSTSDDYSETRADLDDALENEEWWQDIQRLRNPMGMSSSQELAHAEDLLNAVTHWPTASFQHGRHESRPKRFSELKKMLRKKRKTSVANLAEAGLALTMRSQRLPRSLLSDGASSSSDDDSDGEMDEEVIASGSEAATDDDIESYDLNASDDGPRNARPRRAKTMSAAIGSLPIIGKKLDLKRPVFNTDGNRQSDTETDTRPTTASVTPLRPHPDATSSDTALLATRYHLTDSPRSVASTSSARVVHSPHVPQQSLPKFVADPTPRTRVNPQETAGPSIMFVDTPSPSTERKPNPLAAKITTSIDTSTSAKATPSPSAAIASPTPAATAPVSQASPTPATGFPSAPSIPLSFNDLPCRAQHLILNELMRANSDDTAVLFTTLPSPVEGTCESERESVKYISDLEVLCEGLPPTLLVHSNSMTVTMNL